MRLGVRFLLLSLFCGAGGLDLGFEQAGFRVGLSFDKNPDSVDSYNHNRPGAPHALCEDIRNLTLGRLDDLYRGRFAPMGVIGGPPCQSFSQANLTVKDSDPRHDLPLVYARLIRDLNHRSPLHFFVFENVEGLRRKKHAHRLAELKEELHAAGFTVAEALLDASFYSVAQRRRRLFLVGFNRSIYPSQTWEIPKPTTRSPAEVTVRSRIFGLPDPVVYAPGLDPASFAVHPNHWCMRPRSRRFTTPGALEAGDGRNRSFKTLAWDKPSLTVAYGNREVHIHPNCGRRLSVFEALLLQGFPKSYQLKGSLSSQIQQVSEAVPPPLAEAIAHSIVSQLSLGTDNRTLRVAA